MIPFRDHSKSIYIDRVFLTKLRNKSSKMLSKLYAFHFDPLIFVLVWALKVAPMHAPLFTHTHTHTHTQSKIENWL